MGTLRKFTVVFFVFVFFLSFFPVRVSGVVTTSRKTKIQHYIQFHLDL